MIKRNKISTAVRLALIVPVAGAVFAVQDRDAPVPTKGQKRLAENTVNIYDVNSGQAMGRVSKDTEPEGSTYDPTKGTLPPHERGVLTKIFFSDEQIVIINRKKKAGKKTTRKKTRKKATRKKAAKKKASKKKATKKKAKKKTTKTVYSAGTDSTYFTSRASGFQMAAIFTPASQNLSGIYVSGEPNNLTGHSSFYSRGANLTPADLRRLFTRDHLDDLYFDDLFWEDLILADLIGFWIESGDYPHPIPKGGAVDRFLDALDAGEYGKIDDMMQSDMFVQELLNNRTFMNALFPPMQVYFYAPIRGAVGGTEQALKANFPSLGNANPDVSLGVVNISDYLFNEKQAVKAQVFPDDFNVDAYQIGAGFNVNEFNLKGRINYAAIGSEYGESIRVGARFDPFGGTDNFFYSMELKYFWSCDSGQLNPTQKDSLRYQGSFKDVNDFYSNTRIGGFCATHSGYSLQNPTVDIGDLKVGYKVSRRIDANFPGFTASTPRVVTAIAGAKSGSVADAPVKKNKLPNDGFFHSRGSWGQDYDDQWGLKRIGFAPAGRDGKGSLWPKKGKPVVVAVVDTGIDFGHPDLYGTLWTNLEDNPNNDKDDDNNRYLNDFLGWNFVNNGNHTFDDNGHGTFVAGIIAARTDNGLGMAGINPWARIMPVKVADMFGDSNDVDVAQGIAYAAHMGAKVINVSIAGRKLSKIEQAAVDEAVKHGALVIVAAGNDGEDLQDISPAGLDGVITVAATDHKDQRTKYSNWGGKVDIAAPGEEILSLRAIQTDLLQFFDKKYQRGANIMGTQRQYYRLSGTSFAAPFVAGVASLMFSLRPELTPAQVKRMLLQSAKDIDVAGVDQFTGYGLLDAAAALKADPGFFVEAAITGVAVVQVDGKPHLRITGRADADRFKTAWIEIGPGEDPSEWKRVAEGVNKTAKPGTLADVSAAHFAGSKQWIIKIVSEHKNGRKREARFVLKVG